MLARFFEVCCTASIATGYNTWRGYCTPAWCCSKGQSCDGRCMDGHTGVTTFHKDSALVSCLVSCLAQILMCVCGADHVRLCCQ